MTAQVGSGTHCVHGMPEGSFCGVCHLIYAEPEEEDKEEALPPPGPRSRPSGLAERRA